MRNDDRRKDVTTRPQRPPPPHLGLHLAKVCSGIAERTRFADPQLVGRWSEIAGPELARLSSPGRILGGVRNATLEIHVRNGAAAARIGIETDALKRRLNQVLGPGRIGHVQIRQAGADKPPPGTLSRFRSGG